MDLVKQETTKINYDGNFDYKSLQSESDIMPIDQHIHNT